MEHKLKVSVGNLKMELVGSEEFIKQYEEKFSLVEKVEKLVSKRPPNKNGTQTSTQEDQATNGENIGGTNGGENQYPNVFDQSGKIKESIFNIIRDTWPTNADKQRTIALLYLLGIELRTNRKAETTTGEIRDIYYKKYGRPKNMNLKKNLRNKSLYFEIRSKNSSIKLTPDGKNKAEELANQLNDEQAAS